MSIKATPLIAATAAFLCAGLIGAFRYADSYWLYRGFPPPSIPQVVRDLKGTTPPNSRLLKGTREKIFVSSAAIGGRRQPVWVFLPPGYAKYPDRRYPVMYFLHGYPGNPLSFFNVARADILEDVLLVEGRLTPMIEVLPFGSSAQFRDEEWANGVGRASGWETFVARDLVNAIDTRYRTIPSGAGRAIAGLSEGAYGALNIALHHPSEFRVIESWSGYMRAGDIPRIFDHDRRLLAYNSPMVRVFAVARALRADHAYIWFFVGLDDRLLRMNEQFDRELNRLGIDHRFFTTSGAHSWSLWRRYAPNALMVASRHLSPPWQG